VLTGLLLFNIEYLDTGRPLTDLIEPSDGFHPSQTGNAIFGQKFFEFLENEHPEALGPVNPYNAEIDEMFFKNNQLTAKRAKVTV
jgi:acyloxyacyl hydrolase